MKDERVRRAVALFIPAMVEAAEGAPRGVRVEFECPICRSTAYVVKAVSNGHHHAFCPGCGINIAQ